MSVSNPYGKYLENQILTATPAKLLIMSYDAAVRFGRMAQESMRARKLNEQNTYINKCQDIILDLMSALNPKIDRQLTANLEAIYGHMFDKLTKANIHDDQKALEEVVKMLSELRETWIEAERASRAQAYAGRERAA